MKANFRDPIPSKVERNSNSNIIRSTSQLRNIKLATSITEMEGIMKDPEKVQGVCRI